MESLNNLSEESDVHIVNFISKSKQGFGPFHARLLETEYKRYLESLSIGVFPGVYVGERVLTVVYKEDRNTKPSLLDMQNVFLRLRRTCLERNIRRLIIPMQAWVRDGFSLDFMSLLVGKVFAKTGIEIEII